MNDNITSRFGNLEIPGTNNAPKAPSTPNAEVFKDANSSLQVGEFANAHRRDDGTWVNAIGLESTENMRHVAKQWQDQCIPLSTVHNAMKEDAKHKRDNLVAESQVRLNSDLSLPDGTPLTPNGLATLASFTDVKLPTINNLVDLGLQPLVATAVNTELDKREIGWAEKGKDPRKFRVRLRHDSKGNDVARAVVSGRYGVIDNLQALEMIIDAFPVNGAAKDALFSHAFDNGDDVHGNILLPDYIKSEPDSDYGVGIYWRNSEIRNSTFRIDPFLFRAICLNGNIWSRLNSEIKINVKHLGKIDYYELKQNVRHAVKVALSAGNDLLTQLGYTKQVEVEDVNRVIAQLSRDNRLTIEQGKAWHEGYMQTLQERMGNVAENTAFGIVNGLTRAAQKYTGETRAQMEAVAGLVMSPSLDAPLNEVMAYWQESIADAKRLNEDTVQQYVFVRA